MRDALSGPERLARALEEYPPDVGTIWKGVHEALAPLGGALLVFGSLPGGGLRWVVDSGEVRVFSDFDLTLLVPEADRGRIASQAHARVASINDDLSPLHYGFHVALVVESPSAFGSRLARLPVLFHALTESGVQVSGEPFALPDHPVRATTAADLRSVLTTLGFSFLANGRLAERWHAPRAAAIQARWAAICSIKLRSTGLMIPGSATQDLPHPHALAHTRLGMEWELSLFHNDWDRLAGELGVVPEVRSAVSERLLTLLKERPSRPLAAATDALVADQLRDRGEQYNFYKAEFEDA